MRGFDRTTLGACILLAGALFACKKLKGGEETPAASASAPAGSTAAVSAPASNVCKVEAQQVWASGLNQRAGLTATALGDRTAIGVAVGYQPAVLVFDRNGQGRFTRLGAPVGSPLAKGVPAAEGDRDLHRISPSSDGAGNVFAYADYRDVYKNKQRRIACEPVGNSPPLLLYRGQPLIDPDAKPGPKPAQSAVVAAAAPSSSAPPIWSGPAGFPGFGKIKLKTPSGVQAPAPANTSAFAKVEKLHEIRDCRSFVDAGGKDVWAIGSELYGERGAGNKVAWKMRFLVMPGPGQEPIVFHEIKLPDPPGTLYTLESPVAERLADGSYLVAGRYRGALYAWTLASNKTKRSGPRVYSGGSPTLPHFIPDGLDFLLLVSQEASDDRYELRYGRIDGQKASLPSTLVRPAIEGAASMAEPTIGRIGNQRWLSYHGGKRREGQLVILPVNAELAPMGKPYTVTAADQTVYESGLFGLEGGRLLAVFLRNAAGGAELVSETLTCEVKQ